MKFGPVSLDGAEGAILAHTVRAGGTTVKKGTRLTADHLETFRAGGLSDVIVARLEPGDVHEDEAAYTIKADIPGVKKDAIDVRVDGNVVTIGAEVKREHEEKKEGRVLRSERYVGYASRSFTLASDVDEGQADAKYVDGVLTLKLPKKAKASSKRLSVG